MSPAFSPAHFRLRRHFHPCGRRNRQAVVSSFLSHFPPGVHAFAGCCRTKSHLVFPLYKAFLCSFQQSTSSGDIIPDLLRLDIRCVLGIQHGQQRGMLSSRISDGTRIRYPFFSVPRSDPLFHTRAVDFVRPPELPFTDLQQVGPAQIFFCRFRMQSHLPWDFLVDALHSRLAEITVPALTEQSITSQQGFLLSHRLGEAISIIRYPADLPAGIFHCGSSTGTTIGCGWSKAAIFLFSSFPCWSRSELPPLSFARRPCADLQFFGFLIYVYVRQTGCPSAVVRL